MSRQPSGWNWILLVTLTQNFFIGWRGWNAVPDWLRPTWSLAIEEQFYLLWPYLVHKLSLTTLKRLCVCVILVTPALRALISLRFHGYDGPMVYTFCRMDGLCFGTLLALSCETGRLVYMRWLKWLCWPSLALLFFVEKWPDQVISEAPGYTLLAIGCAALVAVCLSPDRGVLSRFVTTIVSAPLLRFVGKISYCLYLVHVAVFAMAASHPAQRLLSHIPGYAPAGWSQVMANWLLAVLIATLSWYVYESPILKLKRRFSSEVTRPETRAASAL